MFSYFYFICEVQNNVYNNGLLTVELIIVNVFLNWYFLILIFQWNDDNFKSMISLVKFPAKNGHNCMP